MSEFELAGAELSWPIGSAAGLSNHPDIETVGNKLDQLISCGFGFVVAGSWTLGEARGGNGYVWNGSHWEYNGGDEYVDPTQMAGYNTKGLPGPGTDRGMERLPDLVDLARSRDTELSLSLSPHSGNPGEELRKIYYVARAALKAGVLYVEANLSCPNVPGRPAFYLDDAGVRDYYSFLEKRPVLLNRFGWPGLWHKFGPLDERPSQLPPAGGVVTSNTLGNQEPEYPDGTPAIEVNNGKAGMSGSALKELGRAQLALWAGLGDGDGTISVLGVDGGAEVKYRLEHGADAVQIGSIAYWAAELGGCDTTAQVVEKVKKELVDAVSS